MLGTWLKKKFQSKAAEPEVTTVTEETTPLIIGALTPTPTEYLTSIGKRQEDMTAEELEAAMIDRFEVLWDIYGHFVKWEHIYPHGINSYSFMFDVYRVTMWQDMTNKNHTLEIIRIGDRTIQFNQVRKPELYQNVNKYFAKLRNDYYFSQNRLSDCDTEFQLRAIVKGS